ncbi:Predicted arabinose efflux permease, MFS family [Paenibacillus sophorae]|uniref:MFS transporter n=1 Tax=Paenibacillus sophorae TaxID=1333845 RepID=A0A1H8J1H8_9BACL|nr:MFS transporter [Paenibacillus sophorae]QWU16152.1 MFS transporter [Paenibacillus sophorae]SEN74007.1 Predicted arabinose efflux permease, MFS family [Paenibacillus sophorae]
MKNSKLKWLVIGSILNNAGISFIWPLNTIYMHDHLGKSLAVAGLVLLIDSITTLIGNFFGGRLFDRIGGYKTVLLGLFISIISLTGLVINHNWPFYAVFLAILGLGTGILFTSVNSLATSLSGYDHRYVFNSIYLGLNIGVAVGTSIAGFIADFDISLIFIANLLLYIAFLIIVLFFYKDIGAIHPQNESKELSEARDRNKRKLLIHVFIICFVYFVVWMGYVQWQSTISAYLPKVNISIKQYSFLWTINALLIILGQPLISLIIKKVAHTYKVQIYVGVMLFVFSFIVLIFSQQYIGFIAAIVLLTLGEMFVFPAIPAMINAISPANAKGSFQSFVNISSTSGRALGPMLGGVIVEQLSYVYLYLAAIILMVLSVFIFHYKLNTVTRMDKKI